MIKFHCDGCSAKLGAPDEYAGKRVKCSKCGKPTRVPDQSPVLAAAPADFSGLDDAEDDAPAPKLARTPAAPAAPMAAPAAAKPKCPKCGASINPGAALCVHCGHSLKYGLNVQTVAKARGAAALTGRVTIGMAIAAVAAIGAGAAWAGIVYGTGYEVGYVAWGLGLLVGFAVAIAWPTPGLTRGLSAAGLAALGLLVGKLLIFQWAVPAEIEREFERDPLFMKAMVTTEMIENREFPPELMTKIDTAMEADEPPADLEAQIDQAVTAKLNGMSDAQKQAMTQASVDRFMATIPYSTRLAATFSPWDGLWFLLALSSAFKLGAGLQSNEERFHLRPRIHAEPRCVADSEGPQDALQRITSRGDGTNKRIARSTPAL